MDLKGSHMDLKASLPYNTYGPKRPLMDVKGSHMDVKSPLIDLARSHMGLKVLLWT